jgi:hypothetical protein
LAAANSSSVNAPESCIWASRLSSSTSPPVDAGAGATYCGGGASVSLVVTAAGVSWSSWSCSARRLPAWPLEVLGCEEVVHLIVHEPLEGTGQRGREGLPTLGEDALEERLGVDRSHELGGHPVAERLLHGGVFGDRPDGLHPLVGVEHVAVRPRAHDRDREDDRGQHNQQRGHDASWPAGPPWRGWWDLGAQVVYLGLEAIPLGRQASALARGGFGGSYRRVRVLAHVSTLRAGERGRLILLG